MAKKFNLPGGLGEAGMMQQVQRLQEQMLEAQEKLADESVDATAGGGAVRIKMSGTQLCQSVEIDGRLLVNGDLEKLQNYVLSAVNLALDKSRKLQQQRLGPLTSRFEMMRKMLAPGRK